MKIIILLLVLDIYCCFLAAGYVIFQDQHSSERLDTSYWILDTQDTIVQVCLETVNKQVAIPSTLSCTLEKKPLEIGADF